MKFIRNIIFIALSSLLVLTGCEKETSVPVIKAVALEIPKDAGEYSLEYVIENADASAVVEASVEEGIEWIYDIKAEPGKVTFTADMNVGTPRSANMTLKYGNAASVVVKINQSSVFEGVFKIEVTDVTPYSCHVTYTPTDYSGNYIFFVMKKSAVMNYLLTPEGLEELYKGDLAYVQAIADNNGLTLEETLPRLPQIYSQNGAVTEMDYTDLAFNTEYIAYCYGMTLDGKKVTDFVMAEFSTAVVQTSDLKFEAEISDITQYSAMIEVTPSNNTDYYYWTYVSEMDYAKYSIEEIMAHMIANIKDYVGEGGQLSSVLHLGPSADNPKDLWAGTEYHIVAWGMDFAGSPTTDPQEVASFKTEAESVTDDCKFKIDVLEVKQEEIKVKVTPTKNDTRYYVALIDETKCFGYGDRQMAQRVVNMENSRFQNGDYPEGTTWADITYTGTRDFYGNKDLSWNFLPEHMYRIYVFGVDENGNITTEVARIDQKTEPAIESDLTIDIKLVKSTWNFGTFEFTPSNDDEYYLPFIMKTEDTEYYKNPDGSYNEEMLMDDIEHYYEDEILYMRKRGKKQVEFYWQSDSDFTMLVCGYAGTNSTGFFELKVHTPEIPFEKSDAEVEVTYKFFDGEELATKFPERWDINEYRESCVMLMQCTPNAAAKHWYAGVWAPLSTYEMGVDHLLALIRNETAPANCIDEYQGTCRPWYGHSWSFSYVAEGEDGNFGKWHSIEFTLTKDMTEEPYDFWTNPYNPENTMIFVAPKTSDKAPENITDKIFKPSKAKGAGSAVRSFVRDIE